MTRRRGLKNQLMILGLICISAGFYAGNRWLRAPMTHAGDMALAPLSSSGSSVSRSILQALTNAANAVREKGANQKLREKVSELESRVASLRSQLVEKIETEQNLRSLVTHQTQISEPVELAADSQIMETSGITAWSVAADSNSFRYSALINRGSSHGVQNRAPVTVGGAVVGQVRSVNGSNSRVLLLCDPGMRAAVRFLPGDREARPGARKIQQIKPPRGLLKGIRPGLCKVEYVERDVDVQTGDTVVTSGEDGQFPSGLLVGKVSVIKRRELFLEVEVTPEIDFSALQSLLVLQPVKDAGSRTGQLATSE
ncbi:MAG: rod shape-determining protein MreC [Planctomycetota bacterium]|nr:rod shape-determining protein MreC [Planctomycetota bacterium]